MMRKRLPKKKTSLRIVRKLPVDVRPAGYERLAKGMFDHKTTCSDHDFAHRSPLAFASFMNDDNFERIIMIAKILDYSSFEESRTRISHLFDCDETEICLMEPKSWRVRNEKTCLYANLDPYVYLHFDRRVPILSWLSNCLHRVWFDGNRKAWSVNIGSAMNASVLSEAFSECFKVVVDLEKMDVFVNQNAPRLGALSRCAFAPIPFHVPVPTEEVFRLFDEQQSHDSHNGKDLYVLTHDGYHRVPYKSTIWTRSPFLIFRRGSERMARAVYMVISTLGLSIEHISFRNSTLNNSEVAFLEACETHKIEAIAAISESVGHQPKGVTRKTDFAAESFRGGFERFLASIEIADNSIEGLRPAYLCSDYMTLTDSTYSASAGEDGVMAYVAIEAAGDSGFKSVFSIAKFFGYDSNAYPVVFVRKFLDEWISSADKDGRSAEFLHVLSHEMGHWLTLEVEDEFPPEDDHGIAWAICTDIVGYLYTGVYDTCRLIEYHPEDPILCRILETMVLSHAIPSIDLIKIERRPNKNDIKRIALECMVRLSGVSLD